MNTAKILPFRQKRHPNEDAIINMLPEVERLLGKKIHMDALGVDLKKVIFCLHEAGNLDFLQLQAVQVKQKQRDL